jgi:HEAT repeat protein
MKFRSTHFLIAGSVLVLAFFAFWHFQFHHGNGFRSVASSEQHSSRSAAGTDLDALGGRLEGKGSSQDVTVAFSRQATASPLDHPSQSSKTLRNPGIVKHQVEPPEPLAPELADRIAELEDLSMNDDADSLKKILAAVTDKSPEIRRAALEAAMQFGSRDAIPELRKISTNTGDLKERTEIQKAIEFLQLPSLTEYLQTHPQVPTPLPGVSAR